MLECFTNILLILKHHVPIASTVDCAQFWHQYSRLSTNHTPALGKSSAGYSVFDSFIKNFMFYTSPPTFGLFCQMPNNARCTELKRYSEHKFGLYSHQIDYCSWYGLPSLIDASVFEKYKMEDIGVLDIFEILDQIRPLTWTGSIMDFV